MNNKANQTKGDAVYLCDFLERFLARQVADFADLFFGQLGVAVILALAIAVIAPVLIQVSNVGTTLVDGILRVVFSCPQEEMVGTNARRIIAVMANHHSVGDLSVSQLISKPMGFDGLGRRQVELTIPLVMTVPCPNPAVAGFVNFGPKAILWGNSFFSLAKTGGTRTRAESLAGSRERDNELCSAKRAFALPIDRMSTHTRTSLSGVPRGRTLQRRVLILIIYYPSHLKNNSTDWRELQAADARVEAI